MNGMKTLIVIGISLTTYLATGVHAASINDRQAAQRDSIRSGIADGSLTRPEAYRLGQQQVRMERKEQRFRADGELTNRERANLQGTASQNRARITRQRHDDQVRAVEE